MPELPSERDIARELGEKRTRILKDNSPHRICGLLTARGRIPEWEEALAHIAEHSRSNRHKTVQTRFAKRLRNPDTLKDYIKAAAGAPSATRLSRQTDGWAQPTGKPCLLILRDFNEPLGEEPDSSWLMIVVNDQGKLVTAYPQTEKRLREKGFLG